MHIQCITSRINGIFLESQAVMYNAEDFDAMVTQTVKEEKMKLQQKEEYEPGKVDYIKKGVLVG